MRVRHKLVLLGNFHPPNVEKVLKRRGVRIHSPIALNPKDRVHEGVICFNPRRISDRRIIDVLMEGRPVHENVGLYKIDQDKENCHDCPKKVA